LEAKPWRNPAQGKVGSAFTSVGGHGRGYGGHEAILSSFHSFFLQHGMVRAAARMLAAPSSAASLSLPEDDLSSVTPQMPFQRCIPVTPLGTI
jgi:multimeric flavodoxin WrbA